MTGVGDNVAEPPRFGEILEADWLFDLYLRHDSRALQPVSGPKGVIHFAARPDPPTKEREPGKDAVLAHADTALAFGSPKRAIVLADDCEIESLVQRKQTSGRIPIAAITPWPSSDDEVKRVVESGVFRRFPLPPSDDFAGGVVEFQRLVSISLPSLTEVQSRRTLPDEVRDALKVRWAAYAIRHGPLVARDGARKAAELLRDTSIDGEALGKAIEHALTAAWAIEGPLLDRVATSLEAGTGEAVELVEALRSALEELNEATGAALGAIART